ncbi:PilZ domain-containing protein [Bowmanella sp. JS7-9]|uniref:PilZ domain-containing protein n=1 Tax=Pseudobowmanella zhangzhouensis TaxID=1537679 RepID=A0ABW1XKG0_9ALTE|nr:PilZ domain-containing protein [Bowmanella sp. JS7-9]TBX23123.1 pilus assembly protein PilZ [Bowmanella sp. JS7-9]
MMGYDDKRNFLRMLVNANCDLTIEDEESTRSIAAICRDISAVGMAFEVGESIEAGTRLKVAIESNSSQIPSLQAVSKVVRCHQNADGAYIVGVEIQEMR